jgi:hypothetical protein
VSDTLSLFDRVPKVSLVLVTPGWLSVIRDDQQRDDPQSLLRIDYTLSEAIIEEKIQEKFAKGVLVCVRDFLSLP